MMMKRRDYIEEIKKTRGYYNEGQSKSSTNNKGAEEVTIATSEIKREFNIS
jgi:hypothetical protein